MPDAVPPPSALAPPAGKAMAVAFAPAALRAAQLKIFGIVAAYFVISISLVFVNKVLLTEGASIPAPLFITAYQCAVTAAICWAAGELGKGAPEGSFFRQFPRFEYRRDVALKLVQLSAIFVAMITFNNLSLKCVGVAW